MINPRLLAISGFPKELIRVVKDGPLILGRDPTNQVAVVDPAVSLKHCSLSEVSSGVFEIADLDSHNGTFVNETQVTRKTVQHGDRIRIGTSEFLFLTGPEDGTDLPGSPSATPAPSSELRTSQLRTMPLDPSGLPTDDSWVGRMARDLAAFFKIANIINSTRDAQVLQHELLTLICEVIPAAQAAIVLQPNANEDPRPPCTWNRNDLAAQEMLIRQELVQQAIWDRCAVITTAPAQATSAEHVLCVPLVAIEKSSG